MSAQARIIVFVKIEQLFLESCANCETLVGFCFCNSCKLVFLWFYGGFLCCYNFCLASRSRCFALDCYVLSELQNMSASARAKRKRTDSDSTALSELGPKRASKRGKELKSDSDGAAADEKVNHLYLFVVCFCLIKF